MRFGSLMVPKREECNKSHPKKSRWALMHSSTLTGDYCLFFAKENRPHSWKEGEGLQESKGKSSILRYAAVVEIWFDPLILVCRSHCYSTTRSAEWYWIGKTSPPKVESISTSASFSVHLEGGHAPKSLLGNRASIVFCENWMEQEHFLKVLLIIMAMQLTQQCSPTNFLVPCWNSALVECWLKFLPCTRNDNFPFPVRSDEDQSSNLAAGK